MVRTRLTLQTIDLHCGGEPLRLITTGYPPVPMGTVLERRRWVQQHADHVRRTVVLEPRGHRDMYAAVLLPSGRPDADLTVLFMHNEGYSTMCGHGTIALATALVEEGLFPATEPETVIRFEAPAGLVTAHAAVRRSMGGAAEVTGVRFDNVPSYLAARDLALRPDGLDLPTEGPIKVDIGFGGAYYGIVDAADLGLRVVPAQTEALTRAGAAITDVLRRDHAPRHPTDADLGFVYGTIIVDHDPASAPDGRAGDADDPQRDGLRRRGGGSFAVWFRHLGAPGAGGLARTLPLGGTLRNASLTGAIFEGRLDAPASVGDQAAWQTSVAGTAYVTGYSTFVVDERDPLGDGFLLR